MLLLLLSGLLLLRLATRQLLALLFQLPPRFTRFEPCGRNPIVLPIVDWCLPIPPPFLVQAAMLKRLMICRRSPSVSANRTYDSIASM